MAHADNKADYPLNKGSVWDVFWARGLVEGVQQQEKQQGDENSMPVHFLHCTFFPMFQNLSIKNEHSGQGVQVRHVLLASQIYKEYN